MCSHCWECGGVFLDCQGHTLRGPGGIAAMGIEFVEGSEIHKCGVGRWGDGIDIFDQESVTIKNCMHHPQSNIGVVEIRGEGGASWCCYHPRLCLPLQTTLTAK